MKALVEAALVGLARAGTPPADPEEPGERLLSRASELPPERAFLLRLGVHAVRARAGLTPARDGERPEAAPPETRPPCSPPLAAIVTDACAGRNKAILVEALTRIDARGLRLPPQGLPALAALRDPSLLPAATNVAGERGRWLARHNPAWRWLVDGVSPASLEERRKAWDEGSPEARLSALRATRATDPAEARAWIEAAWKAEKADFREEMVAALVTNLSADDEPLLTQALADRAAGVRAAAVNLLARIETSPFAARARQRAEPLLSYDTPARGVFGALKSRLAGEARGVLSVSPPTAFDRAWAADGLVEKPPTGTGERAFWLRQMVSMVPPAHWEQRLGASIEALVNAATKTEWAQPLLAGWIEATVRFAARGWAEQLWAARIARASEGALALMTAPWLAPSVFPLMDAARVHETVAEIVEAGGPMDWTSILTKVPTPWNERLTDAFIRALRRVLTSSQLDWQEAHAWGVCFDFAAPAMPPTRLDHVLGLEPPTAEAGAQRLVAAFDSFRSVLAIRKRIDQETRFVKPKEPALETTTAEVQRQHAEQEFAGELAALAAADDRARPPSWKLSPWAVRTYLLGGKLADGFVIKPKYVGNARLIEIAVATLATDRALLLLGVPGTAKSWVAEHLAAAISGDSTLLVQGTAGTDENALRYGWNYARLLAEGPTTGALVPSPLMKALEAGKIARVEELTRVPSEVQDTLISILSEKTLPIPELGLEVQARRGFNVIATANNRDKGVNDLSSALLRRFNTVVLPLPETIDDEIAIVSQRVSEMGRALALPAEAPALQELRRLVTIFRELRSGVTEDGKTKLKTPSGSLSTAEAISVVNHGLAIAAYYGDGVMRAGDVAAGLTGAVVKDPVQDRVVWLEYLETVVKEREGWKDLYRSCKEVL